MTRAQESTKPSTVIGLAPIERILILIVPPIVGLILGYFIPPIAHWAADLPWFPFQDYLQIIANIQEKWAVIITTILGLFAGVWLTVAAITDSLEITVTEDEVKLKIKGVTQSYSKSDIAQVYLDGKQLVLLGINGLECAREPYESTPANIEKIFVKYRYPWFSGVPQESAYRLWMEDALDLSASLNVLLKAREEALHRKDEESAAEIRLALGKLGITVRDKGRFQYWRKLGKIDAGD